MSDMFTPQIRELLDRLEAPALQDDFADRLVARAEAQTALPPLPPLRKARPRRLPRIALAIGAAMLVSVAAAAAVVPVDTWRKVPVIGELVELVAPTPPRPVAAPLPPQPIAAQPAAVEPVAVEPVSATEPALAPVVHAAPPQPVATQVVTPPPPVAENAPRPEPSERVREAPLEPQRVM